MRRIAAALFITLIASAALAGCGSGSSSSAPPSSPNGSVTATGTFGQAPTVKIPAKKAGANLYVKTEVQGGGTPLVGVKTISYAFMLMMVGAVLGYGSLIFLTDGIGRRGSYFLFGLGSLLSSLYLFLMIKTLDDLMWFMPVYGYFIIGGFGTFAAYLPELFPTRVRATGQGFCWNAARCLTAIGPLIGGVLVGTFGSFPAAAASTAIFYAIGLIAIWFGPETWRKPLTD